jgi:hypothetical protein
MYTESRLQRAHASPRRMHAGSCLQDRRNDTVTARIVPDGCMTSPGSAGFTHAPEAGEVVLVPGQGEAERSMGGSPYVPDQA